METRRILGTKKGKLVGNERKKDTQQNERENE
jgi:hypothetical protein